VLSAKKSTKNIISTFPGHLLDNKTHLVSNYDSITFPAEKSAVQIFGEKGVI
jgi:hypothetical protein